MLLCVHYHLICISHPPLSPTEHKEIKPTQLFMHCRADAACGVIRAFPDAATAVVMELLKSPNWYAISHYYTLSPHVTVLRFPLVWSRHSPF